MRQPRGLALTQQRQCAINEVKRLARFLGLLIGAPRLTLQSFDPPLQALEVGEHQFGFDGLDIGNGIDAPFDMRHVGIFKTAYDMRNGVDFANVGKELVAEPLPF